MSSSHQLERYDGTSMHEFRQRISLGWNSLPLAVKGLVVVSIPLSALLVAVLSFFMLERQDRQAHLSVRQTLELQSRISDVMTLLLGAETGVRGYLLVGTPEFLKPYQQALASLDPSLDTLAKLLQNDPVQEDKLAHIRTLAQENLAILTKLSSNLEQLPPESELKLLQESRASLEQLGQALSVVRTQEDVLLTAHIIQADKTRDRTITSISGSAAYGLIGGLIATLLFTFGIVRRVRSLEVGAWRLADDRSLPPPPSGNDEIGRLGQALYQASDLLSSKSHELSLAQIEIVERLAQAADHHDDQTGQHIKRVGEISARLASALNFSAHEVELLRRAAPLHDVGKIGVPDRILFKPGRLSSLELEQMRSHTALGATILSAGRFRLMRMAEAVAHSHHEHWDGSGYPLGLKGEEIPLVGRIVAVADTFDALLNQRPYKSSWPLADALHEVERQSGKQFDPMVVEAFLQINWRGWLMAQGWLAPLERGPGDVLQEDF